MGRFCLVVDAPYVVNTTNNQVEHNLWVVYQEYVQICLKYYGNLVFESNCFPILQTIVSSISLSLKHEGKCSDFRITPVKSGVNTVRLHWSKTGICSVLTLGASLGFIICTVLIRKSEKKVESPQGLSEKFAHRNSLGSSDFPLGLCPFGIV